MKKILIVEDEASFVFVLKKEFEREGYEVISADNGKKGLEEALEQKPDLILLDLMMPVMDGFEVMSQLRQDAYGKKAKVIVLTNLEPDKETLGKILSNKPVLYLIKSNIQLAELMVKVKTILAQLPFQITCRIFFVFS